MNVSANSANVGTSFGGLIGSPRRARSMCAVSAFSAASFVLREGVPHGHRCSQLVSIVRLAANGP